MGNALRVAVEAVQRRWRWQRALRATSRTGAVSIAALVLAVIWARLRSGSSWLPSAAYAVGLILPLLAAGAAGLRRVPGLSAAQRIDRSHATADLIASGWAFLQLPAASRSRFMQATLASANELAGRAVVPARALPWRWPRSLWAWPLLALAALAAARIPQLRASEVRAPARPVAARLLGSELIAAQLRGLDAERKPQDPQLRELSSELARLLEQIGEQRIDRLELLRALSQLEARLTESSPADASQREQVQRELRDLGRALARSSPTQKLGSALEAAQLADARSQLQALAKRIDSPPDLRELERLREALREALAQHDESKAEQRAKQARAEAEKQESLLRKQKGDGGNSSQGAEWQRKRKRELDKLLREERDRRSQQQAEAGRGSGAGSSQQRELDQLERALADAAARGSGPQQRSQQGQGKSGDESQNDGSQQSGAAARDLERAAESLERMSQAEQDERARERLQQRVAELRQLLAERREAQGPSAEDGSGGQPLTLEKFRRNAQAEESKSDAEAMRLSVQKREQSSSDRSGGGQDQPLGGRRVGSGEQAPSAEGRPARGSERKSGEAAVDVSIAGVMGQGPSRSSVIYDAAARGFGARGYQKVHADYAAHAEAELEREPLPPGYRFYVRRYFDLIQPPEDRHE